MQADQPANTHTNVMVAILMIWDLSKGDTNKYWTELNQAFALDRNEAFMSALELTGAQRQPGHDPASL